MADKTEARTATKDAPKVEAPEFNKQDTVMVNVVDDSGENMKQAFVMKFQDGQRLLAVDEGGQIYTWTEQDYMSPLKA